MPSGTDELLLKADELDELPNTDELSLEDDELDELLETDDPPLLEDDEGVSKNAWSKSILITSDEEIDLFSVKVPCELLSDSMYVAVKDDPVKFGTGTAEFEILTPLTYTRSEPSMYDVETDVVL